MTCKIPSLNIIDLPTTSSAATSFIQQVQALELSAGLEAKCFAAESVLNADDIAGRHLYLSKNDEGELATEVLLQRHRFTQLVAQHCLFRQAALTIIQNIYLSKDRKIFFARADRTSEAERQEALQLFSQPTMSASIPLAKTFQHLVLARVWARIIYKADPSFTHRPEFRQLQAVIERLNTLRNIYMLLTTGLVRKITSQISNTYKQSITAEDAHQIGSFGVARAAYRYHPSMGSRFSTYASFWILREVQLQSLNGRLIRVPATIIEEISRSARKGDTVAENAAVTTLMNSTVILGEKEEPQHEYSYRQDPAKHVEQLEMHSKLLEAVDSVLPAKSADIVKRKYGLGEYEGRAQSMVEISRIYGVTRGSVYQLEKKALLKLHKHLHVSLNL
ncbi:sigma-70 family RNA polymerase sigma factor [Desulfogranum marinum]|uniref:sigma-70 family RNA polymerase sigma factor n=1 Tax=Desulfogranum marinum TaxID=453220 RepID=UPI0019639786|nr:sigma-70 family RNA polymerase sigma factor [Desulfogranum marinum]MBM9512943.1 sigma-70 family RNA polymerase sigma factor [Desulfogranum marinum]